MKQPFFKPSQSVYFDSDVNPEGVAVAFNRGRWFGSAYALQRNWTLNATYFLNDRNMDVPNMAGATDVDFDRLQLDVNLKF